MPDINYKNRISKDAQSILDFSIDMSELLQDTEIIQSSTWTIPTGLTAVTNTFDDYIVTVWLSGGTLNEIYEVKNVAQTNSTPQRTFVNRIYIPIVKK